MASYYIFGLYIVRRYYAEKQQQQQQNRIILNFFFVFWRFRLKLPFESFDYDVVWHKRAGVTNWKMRCLHSSGYRLTKDSHLDIGRDVSTFHYIIHFQFIRRLREP